MQPYYIMYGQTCNKNHPSSSIMFNAFQHAYIDHLSMGTIFIFSQGKYNMFISWFDCIP